MKTGTRYKQDISHKNKQRNPKNKKTKSVLVFDEAAREDYLTGFSKRKKERKRIAHEKEIERLREEKREVKRKRREVFMSQFDQQAIPEVENIAETQTYDLQDHTVSITDVSEVDFVGKSGLRLGVNTEVASDEEDESKAAASGSEAEEEEGTGSKSSATLTKKKLKHMGNEKVWKPKWERHTNYSHIMNHKNKRLKREADKRKTVKKKKKPRNQPH